MNNGNLEPMANVISLSDCRVPSKCRDSHWARIVSNRILFLQRFISTTSMTTIDVPYHPPIGHRFVASYGNKGLKTNQNSQFNCLQNSADSVMNHMKNTLYVLIMHFKSTSYVTS